jgi:hypothetical protein
MKYCVRMFLVLACLSMFWGCATARWNPLTGKPEVEVKISYEDGYRDGYTDGKAGVAPRIPPLEAPDTGPVPE